MDIVFNLLLFIHLVALVVGAATNVAMPLIGRQMAGSAPDVRERLGTIGRTLSMNSRIALAVLVFSGIALLWVRYGGVDGASDWFWAKMALVVVVIILAIVGAIAGPGRINPRVFGVATRLLLLGIVFTAVFAFN
jgi:uncharacterized membrane protein